MASVLQLTDRFALENHNTSSGVVFSDNLCKHCKLLYIPSLISDLSYMHTGLTAVEVNESSKELVEVFSDCIKQYGKITLNSRSSVFKNVNITGMFSLRMFSLRWY